MNARDQGDGGPVVFSHDSLRSPDPSLRTKSTFDTVGTAAKEGHPLGQKSDQSGQLKISSLKTRRSLDAIEASLLSRR
jgi:hypothetical protein